MRALEDSQCMRALAAANEVRIARADLKKDVKAYRVDPVALIQQDPTPRELEKVTVLDFIAWVPYIGAQKSVRITRGIITSQTLTLKDLSPATRDKLGKALAEYLGHYNSSRQKRGLARVGYVAQAEPVAA